MGMLFLLLEACFGDIKADEYYLVAIAYFIEIVISIFLLITLNYTIVTYLFIFTFYSQNVNTLYKHRHTIRGR